LDRSVTLGRGFLRDFSTSGAGPDRRDPWRTDTIQGSGTPKRYAIEQELQRLFMRSMRALRRKRQREGTVAAEWSFLMMNAECRAARAKGVRTRWLAGELAQLPQCVDRITDS